MANAETTNKKNLKVNFSMKMPDWFIEEHDVEKQKNLINKLKTRTASFREVTVDDLKGLAINSKIKGKS
jgi:hypothetical protein